MKCRNGHGAKGCRKMDVKSHRHQQGTDSKPNQSTPATVIRPVGSTQAGEAKATSSLRERWAWVEAGVWTDRMLTALEQGVKGGVWFSLSDKVWHRPNLRSAWLNTAANKGSPGVDDITIASYQREAQKNLEHLSQSLRNGSYRPKAIRRVHIPKGDGKTRPLGIPTVQDRIVQGAILHIIEPIFERQFAEQSYGFRPGRGCKDALRRVDQLLKAGYGYVVDADLKSYFDTIPHDRLMQVLRRTIADKPLLTLIERFLHANIMEGTSTWKPTTGAPQGAVLSPLLSNIYLNDLDHLMARNGQRMVRYADDFVILCQTREQADQALAMVREWTAQSGLTLHPEKTRIVHAATECFEFLGYRFDQGRKFPRKKSLRKLRDAIRERTRRTNGQSMEKIIQTINPTLRGWFNYFQHCYRTTFPTEDGWIRMRLRSILRKRCGRTGHGRGEDHKRWPNAYFSGLGLYSLTKAHQTVCESLKGAH